MTKVKSNSRTIRDVASAAGVSVATVSRFINRSTPVSDEIADRIQAAMQSLRYTPNQVARQLATNRTFAIGLLLSDIAGDFFTPLLEGIEQISANAGYNLLVSSTRGMSASPGYQPGVGPHNSDGVVVFTESLDENWLKHWHEENFPVVLVHQTPPPGLSIPCVTVENKAASQNIVEHLIHVHNRRRIVFVRGETGHEDASWREMGYRNALAQADLPYDPQLVVPGEFDRHVAFKSISDLIQRGTKFDGIFSADDESALGVLEALKEAHIRVPQDVSVVGFDDLNFAPYLSPSLTTVRAPTSKVGEVAAQLLLHLIGGLAVEPLVLLPTEIILRESCGC